MCLAQSFTQLTQLSVLHARGLEFLTLVDPFLPVEMEIEFAFDVRISHSDLPYSIPMYPFRGVGDK